MVISVRFGKEVKKEEKTRINMLISDVRIEWPTLGQNIALQYYSDQLIGDWLNLRALLKWIIQC